MRRSLTPTDYVLAAFLVIWASCGIAAAQFAPVGSWVQGSTGAPCGSHTAQTTSFASAGPGITLSNSNFTADLPFTGGSLAGAIGSASAKHTGKWYFLIHIDVAEASATGWNIGIGNASSVLTREPGGAANTAGCYNGNFYVNNLAQGTAGTGFNTNGHFGIWAVDLTANLSWCAVLSDACALISNWSGSGASNDGNPSTGFHGIDTSAINDGVAVLPAWGARSFVSDNQGTLFTSTVVTDSTLTGFSKWD